MEEITGQFFFFREMKGLAGHAAFGNVEGKFNLTRCIRQSIVEASTLWSQIVQAVYYGKWRKMDEEVSGSPILAEPSDIQLLD